MNIPAIKKLCMEAKRIYIMHNYSTREHWISDGSAAWLVDEGIFVNEDNVLPLFDIDPTAKKVPHVISEAVPSEKIFTRDRCQDEELLEDLGAIWCAGELYRALRGKDGMLFICIKKLKPVRADGYCEFYMRRSGGKRFIAVYGDMFCSALLAPITGKLAEGIRQAAVVIAAAPVDMAGSEAAPETAEEDAEQIGMAELVDCDLEEVFPEDDE